MHSKYFKEFQAILCWGGVHDFFQCKIKRILCITYQNAVTVFRYVSQYFYVYKVKQEIIYTYIHPRPKLGHYNITPDNQVP